MLARNWVLRMVYTSVVVIWALCCATDTFGRSGKSNKNDELVGIVN